MLKYRRILPQDLLVQLHRACWPSIALSPRSTKKRDNIAVHTVRPHLSTSQGIGIQLFPDPTKTTPTA